MMVCESLKDVSCWHKECVYYSLVLSVMNEVTLSNNSASIGGAVAGAVLGLCILLLVVIFYIAHHRK